MDKTVQRSKMSVPVNIERFLAKAHLRGADAIMLDLEDAIPPGEKESARKQIEDTIPMVGRGGASVSVRINSELSLLPDDVEASVHPGLDGIVLPKAESAEDVNRLNELVGKYEQMRGMAQGSIKFDILIESPAGLLRVEEIARSSGRIQAMAIGMEDYCLTLGVEPSPDGMEIFYPLSKIVTVCKAVGIVPMGLLGSIGDFTDLKGFERSADRARQLGCEGAACIHPNQVTVLNRVFSPPEDKVDYAQRVVEAFEKGMNRGTASVNVDGKMVDIPVYYRAKGIIKTAEAIAAVEKNKAAALARLTEPR